MIKKNIKIKKKLTTFEKIEATKEIFNSYFIENKNNEIEYTPYFGGMARVLAFIKYFIEGITFDDKENIYESITNDEELMQMYYGATLKNFDFIDILKDVDSMVEFKKNKILSKNITLSSKLDYLIEPISLAISTLNKKIAVIDVNDMVNSTKILSNNNKTNN